MGGFAHLATLVAKLKASRPGALLLDGGDTWQGSGTALWTKGQDMVDAQKLLGVDVMTGHWEFTLGADRVKAVVDRDFAGKIDFVAQNVKTADFGDPVFPPYVIRDDQRRAGRDRRPGVSVHADRESALLRRRVDVRHPGRQSAEGRRRGARQGRAGRRAAVAQRDGRRPEARLARVRHRRDPGRAHARRRARSRRSSPTRGGKTLVTNAGSNGKFLAVLDLDVKGGRVADFRYRLLPVFSALLPADPGMSALIEKVRAPYAAKLGEKLAVTEGLLYRRGNFNGTADQLILDGLMAEKNAEIAFSPGFRWGTTLLPGQAITFEHLMDQTAITYPYVTVNELTGETIKTILEDVADNLFNPDPYYQQGGDMVRVGGLRYAIDPAAKMGSRITAMTLRGKPLDPAKKYKVAGWAPVSEEAKAAGGEPVWDVMARYLRAQKTVPPLALNLPKVEGVAGNPGLSA